MPSFSVRNGFEQPRTLIQIDSLDDATRMSLWNVLVRLQRDFQRSGGPNYRAISEAVWTGYLRGALDECPYPDQVWDEVKNVILKHALNEVFDLIEHFSEVLDQPDAWVLQEDILVIFKTNLVGYSIIGAEIVPIDSPVDVEAVKTALSETGPIPAARHHLSQAIELLSNRESPDYPNSVKESISAVESVARQITSASTLGEALKTLARNGVEVHPALEKAWSAMYGWTSADGGIRHGSSNIAQVDQALAKYMLISCSAFVSLLIESGRKAGKL